jgi:hypothetical protein
LTISKAGTDVFEFEIDAASGANVGGIKGTAKVFQDKAVFFDEEGSCEVILILKGEIIKVKTTDCSSHGGIGVEFDGEYKTVR